MKNPFSELILSNKRGQVCVEIQNFLAQEMFPGC